MESTDAPGSPQPSESAMEELMEEQVIPATPTSVASGIGLNGMPCPHSMTVLLTAPWMTQMRRMVAATVVHSPLRLTSCWPTPLSLATSPGGTQSEGLCVYMCVGGGGGGGVGEE